MKHFGGKNIGGKKKNTKLTRGNGLLEGFLAKKRAKIANKLIPSHARNGKLLDIGCGTYPYFLKKSHFKEKFGIDKVINKDIYETAYLSLVEFDLEHNKLLPFDGDYFDVVTMLAVIEHIEPTRAVNIVRECHRVLKEKGTFIMTTPALWAEKLLKGLAILRLVSKEEILEHKDAYNDYKVAFLLQSGGFDKKKMKFGKFELFMNIWAKATK